MIDKDNIYIFDYIFSRNKYREITYNNSSDEQEKNTLIDMIKEKYDVNDFLKKNKELFNKECLNRHEDTYELGKFPKLNLDAQIKYLDFKAQQIKEMIKDQGMVEIKELNKILKDIDDVGKKVF